MTSIDNGHYTIVRGEDHRTFRVSSRPDFANGKQTIAMLTGPNNESDYVTIGFVTATGIAVWLKMQSWAKAHPNTLEHAQRLVRGEYDQHDAGKAYAVRSGNCYRCNRLLTTPESIVNGIGPVCAKKAA